MIRKSKPSDVEKMLEIWLDGSRQSHDFVNAEYWQKMLPSVRKYYLPNTDSYVFEDKHQVKGFISTIDDKYVGALFVAKEFQNQKIGSKLLRYLKERYSELSLKVFEKNKRALRFYQKNGFKIMDVQVDESTNENEILMSWALACKTGYYKRYPSDS